MWKDAPESTTQLVGERGWRRHGCKERDRVGALTEPVGGEGDNKVSIIREAIAPLGKTSDLCAW